MSTVRNDDLYLITTAILKAAVNTVAKRTGLQQDEREVLADMEVEIKDCGLSKAERRLVRRVLGDVRRGIPKSRRKEVVLE